MGRPEHSSYSSLLGTMPSFKYCALRYWRRGSVCVTRHVFRNSTAIWFSVPSALQTFVKKNYAGHQNACLAFARMPFAFTHLQRNHFFLQQSGKQKLCHAFVFHHVLEDHIIDRIGYNCHRLISPFVSVTGLSQRYWFFMRIATGEKRI